MSRMLTVPGNDDVCAGEQEVSFEMLSFMVVSSKCQRFSDAGEGIIYAYSFWKCVIFSIVVCKQKVLNTY